jgi:redox-sensitive bicupin YhaK (pirin superfamily)
MGDIWLDQALPVDDIEQVDPFLLIHHWKTTFPGGQQQREVGVGPHPHRGFSPVTFIFEGGLHHRDSRGNDQVIYQGGTQWMHSGMGIIHSERPAQELASNGGDFEIIQFWVNVPKTRKMVQPSYQPLSSEQTPKVKLGPQGSTAGVVAGTFGKVSGPIKTESPLMVLRFELSISEQFDFQIPDYYNALLYTLDGSLVVNEQNLSPKSLLIFDNGPGSVEIQVIEETKAILLAGLPLEEPVSSYGPFVMNDQSGILHAMNDYQMGKMGVLIEDFS